MLDVITSSPTVGAYRCLPFSTDEIDAHPDADRIWATIVAIRASMEADAEEAYESGASDAKAREGEAYDEGREQCAEDLRDALDNLADESREALEAALEQMADNWT